MITSKELALMRRTAGLMLPGSCTIQTRTRVFDGQGGETETWTDATNIPCKLDTDVPQHHSTEGDQYRVHDFWVFKFRYDQTIESGSRVVFESDTYEVVTVEDDTTWRALRRAYVRKVV